jgi:lysophospholipase L1-like esterase
MVPWRTMLGIDAPHIVVAQAGSGWEAPDGGLAATAPGILFPQARNRAGCIDILVMSGGQSDILNGASGATAHTRALDYANDARTAGFDAVLVTTMPPLASSVVAGAWSTPFQDYNAAVLADGSWDAVADLWQESPWGDDPANLTDGLHPSADAAQLFADIIRPVLVDLIESLT